MLRLIVNKAKHHYNLAIEHAERNRFYEATTELQNCLDLNKSFVPAHVLLGTVYAKQKKIQKAINEWETALRIEKTSQKAYNYLKKAKQVETALPVLKWVKILLAGLAVSIVVIFLLSFRIFRPNPSEMLLKNAAMDYNNKQYGQSLRKIETFSQNYGSSSLLPLGKRLAESIRNEIEEHKRKILKQLYAGNHFDVIEICNQLDRLHPDPASKSFLEQIRQDIQNAIEESIEERLAEFEEDPAHPTLIRQEIENYIKYYPGNQKGETYRNRLAYLSERDLQKEREELQEKLKEIMTMPDHHQTLSALIRFNREHPEFSKETFVPRKIQGVKQALFLEQIERIQAHIEKGNHTRAEVALKELPQEALEDFPLLAQEYKNLQTLFARRKREAKRRQIETYLNKLESAVQSENTSLIQSLLSEKDTYSFSQEERARVEDTAQMTRTRSAITQYNQLTDRDPPLKPESVSEELAKKTITVLPSLTKDLPPEIYRRSRDKILYYAGTSHMRLGEKEKARKLFQDLMREYPYSPYVPMMARMIYEK